MSGNRPDVLIVGSGSAGSVLAERLSVDPARRVTVIEAGPGLGDPAVPALIRDGLALPIGPGSPVVRRYRTLLTDSPPRTVEIVRGFCLGGSGAVNGGYFCRALPSDFSDPVVPSWAWSEVADHYRAIEARIPARVSSEFTGPTNQFIVAARAAGFDWLPHLDAEGDGVAAVPLNIVDGLRMGPGAAFLQPVMDRPNLSVVTGTEVRGVRIVGSRVVGVDALGPYGPVFLAADRVVLSAGALRSAHLLMLSGIGPAADLESFDIPVVANLPVGQCCWDHPEWTIPTNRTSAVARPVVEAVLVTDGLEIRPYTVGFGGSPPGVGVALMRPRARGCVSLASADPSVPPRIEHHYDREATDVSALRSGCALVAEMLGSALDIGEPAWSTSQHLCGTAPMGVDEHAVVDARCRVRGVDGLWVVDGSVLPWVTSRGPHATIAMVGHRAAEFV